MTLVPHAIKVRSVEDVWTVSRSGSEAVHITLRIGPQRPLVAVVTEAELASVANVMPSVAEAVRRGEFSRIQLATMFRTAIGRDPFRQAATAERRPVRTGWWANVAYIVVSLGLCRRPQQSVAAAGGLGARRHRSGRPCQTRLAQTPLS